MEMMHDKLQLQKNDFLEIMTFTSLFLFLFLFFVATGPNDNF